MVARLPAPSGPGGVAPTVKAPKVTVPAPMLGPNWLPKVRPVLVKKLPKVTLCTLNSVEL